MLAQARRAVFALAHLVGQVPMDFETEDRSPADAIRLFMELVGTASRSSQMALHELKTVISVPRTSARWSRCYWP